VPRQSLPLESGPFARASYLTGMRLNLSRSAR
jgi:hypothetical protein